MVDYIGIMGNESVLDKTFLLNSIITFPDYRYDE